MSATEHLSTPRAPAFGRILCAVDGSTCSNEAVAQAATLAGRDAALMFLSVSDVGASGAASFAALGPSSAGQAVDWACRRAREHGVRATTMLRHGQDPSAVILDQARRHDLLVLGAHGYAGTGGVLEGSTPAEALRRSPVPVLLARRAPARHPFPHDILLAWDGTPGIAAAVAATAALAARHGSRVTLLHVGTDRLALTEDVAAVWEATGCEPRRIEVEGDPRSRIVEVAHDLGASLVVTGARTVWPKDSVSEAAGLLAHCSVLVMRAAGARSGVDQAVVERVADELGA